MAACKLFLISLVAVVTALPAEDLVIQKLHPVRYHYLRDADGNTHLVDLWVKVSDLLQSARYSPDTENEYHLFTRLNPTVSQPIVYNNEHTLSSSNFSPDLRTVVLIHGWMNSATSEVNTVLIPAFLAAYDCNVIVVDWSAGAGTVNYAAAVLNTVTSGQSVAMFLNWLCSETGISPATFHIAGHSLGGQQSGIVGRNLDSLADYITALDPALPGWQANENVFKPGDGSYTEVIHTNAGALGFATPLGQVDFYPNGGVNMPGCASITCDHSRAYYYFAESVQKEGFTGTKCADYESALLHSCDLSGRLQMGGITPKTGQTGVYYLPTNAAPPFSMD